jgi:pimeloyl-ACP methyl ester carboxylesterase
MHMRDIYAAIPQVTIPVEIIRARSRRDDESPFDFSPSPTWERLAEFFPCARDQQLTDRSHFIPMELPAWTAERIAAFADALRPL